MNKIIFGAPLILVTLLLALNGVGKEMLGVWGHLDAQLAFASNCCFYPSNGDNPKADSIFEHGLDTGTILAENGGAPPNYDECVNDTVNQQQYGDNVGAFCSGEIQGYEATAK